MEKQSEVVVFGTWASSYCKRVEMALALKGIPYEYIEEDLTNKSKLLLHYNPVHKKVPILVHNGKSIAESLVILEYINDCWKHAPKLLPDDPYLRAKLRFWANFYDQKLKVSTTQIIMSRGEERENEQSKISAKCLRCLRMESKRIFLQNFLVLTARTWGFSILL
ncbi:hypothetical protein CIPAW_06G084600 [Carya illinoinensis]|uniref:Glutathione S-transferase n=1 Tax=Carya illinoinensis TaxID=32201 RepID=A0A8T1Q9P5_CARIL|nr:hypothetical protein CIPAW_06G084600 [Carya illinoinensis]KAG6708530.1 hypothetical protein I3842_06G085200 [Carya illinoinensis]